MRSGRLPFDPETRALRHAAFELTLRSGEARVVEVEPAGDCGVYLEAAGYGPYKDSRHGQRKGELPSTASTSPTAEEFGIGKVGDVPVRVREGRAEGYAIHEYVYSSAWPEDGLHDDRVTA